MQLQISTDIYIGNTSFPVFVWMVNSWEFYHNDAFQHTHYSFSVPSEHHVWELRVHSSGKVCKVIAIGQKSRTTPLRLPTKPYLHLRCLQKSSQRREPTQRQVRIRHGSLFTHPLFCSWLWTLSVSFSCVSCFWWCCGWPVFFFSCCGVVGYAENFMYGCRL